MIMYEKKGRKINEWIDNDVGDEGARMISDSLKVNSTLTKLGLCRDNDKWIINRQGKKKKKYMNEKR